MKNDLEHISILISKYFNGSLSDTESTEFDQLLISNPEAKMLFDDEIVMRSILIEADLIDIKNQMQTDLNKPNSFKYWSASIIALCFLAGSSWFLLNTSNENNKPEESIIQNIFSGKEEKHKKVIPLSKETIEVKVVKETKSSEKAKLKSETSTNKNTQKTISENNEEVPVSNEMNDEIETADIIAQENSDETYDCSKFIPIISATATPCTYNEANGTITITEANNNWVFSLNNPDKFSYEKTFSNISAGKYDIWVKNEYDCKVVAQEIVVPEEYCVENSNDKFFVDYNAEWEVEYIKGVECKIHIYDKAYKSVFSRLHCKNDEVFWDGMDLNGNRVPVGLYKVVIEYKNGKTCISNVTVIE